jgi:Tol biopolymer transport system component
MQPDGKGKRYLIPGLYPSWTSDSAGVLFIGAYEELYRVLVADPDSVVQLTFLNQDEHTYRITEPQMAPDGLHIAFAAKVGAGLTNLWLMKEDGTDLQQLTSDGTTEWLSWAPNSTEITYVTYRPDDWSATNGSIWTIDIQSRQHRELIGP